MDKLRITGGRQLKGEINVSGAKNAALPILCAGLLTADTITLTNVPRLNDISTTLKLLGQMGVRCDRDTGNTVSITANQLTALEAPYARRLRDRSAPRRPTDPWLGGTRGGYPH